MFRFVVSPDHALVPDLAGKLPGRGIWLSASGNVIQVGDGKNQKGKYRDLVRAVSRAARGPVQVPPDLPAVLEAMLIRRIGDLLGFARRAGQAVAGFEKARDWMRRHPAGLVLQAADGSEAERSRFRSAVPKTTPVLSPLTGADMGRIFGRDTVVHVAMASGQLAASIVMEGGRLAGLQNKAAHDAVMEKHPPQWAVVDEKAPQWAVVDEKAPQWAATRDTAVNIGVTGTNG